MTCYCSQKLAAGHNYYLKYEGKPTQASVFIPAAVPCVTAHCLVCCSVGVQNEI